MRALFQNATKSIVSPDWDGFWSGMISTGSEWKWSDRSGVYYFNWRAGEPNNWEGQVEDCVEIYNDGTWNDDPCENELPFVCKDSDIVCIILLVRCIIQIVLLHLDALYIYCLYRPYIIGLETRFKHCKESCTDRMVFSSVTIWFSKNLWRNRD